MEHLHGTADIFQWEKLEMDHSEMFCLFVSCFFFEMSMNFGEELNLLIVFWKVFQQCQVRLQDKMLELKTIGSQSGYIHWVDILKTPCRGNSVS